MPKLIADAVSPTETGIATGMNTVVRTVGSVIGSQAAVTLLASETIAEHLDPRRVRLHHLAVARARRAALIAALLALGDLAAAAGTQ